MQPISRAALIAAVLISSLAATPVPRPAGQTGRPTTEAILQQLGGVPCPDDSIFTCVTLDLPLDHFNPAETRTTPVTFAVLAATGERKGMFVTVTGGPGTAGIASADSYTSGFDPEIPSVFDIVFFDQRGAALSGGLTCPEAAVAYYQVDSRAVTPAQENALKQAARTFSRACVEEMGDPDLLPFMGTAQAIEDLEAFREVMQDDKFWLYGESYGTQFSQAYAAAHGEHLAALLLDGTVDLTLDLFDYYTEQASAFDWILAGTLAACDDDPACAGEMRRAGGVVYDSLAARLARGPIAFRFPLPEGGLQRRLFSLADLQVTVGGQMYSEGDRMFLNRALAAYAAHNDLAPLARLLYLSLGLDPQTLEVIPDPSYSDGMYYAVECQDYGLPGANAEARATAYLRAGDPVEAATPRLGSYFYGDLPCAYWPEASTDTSRPAALTADGIPTIVLGATADPATPVGNGHRVYKRLDDGYLFIQQGGPHVIFGRGNPCPDEAVTDFLVNDQPPDEREIDCEGVFADDYVPLAPRYAAAFADQLEALASAETEIYYLPEYYYWYGDEPDSAGCALGGTLGFEPTDVGYAFTLDRCAFTRSFVMTGTGSYDTEADIFTLNVTTAGRWRCTLEYVRTEDSYAVTGDCGGEAVELEG